MKKLLVTLAILLSYNVSFCQIAFYAPKEAETATKALERPLFIKILSVDEKIMAKLTEDEKKAYVKETEDYNNVLKTSVAKYWTLHKNPTFVTSARLEEMDSEGVECTVLSFGPYQAGKALSEQSDASTIRREMDWGFRWIVQVSHFHVKLTTSGFQL